MIQDWHCFTPPFIVLRLWQHSKTMIWSKSVRIVDDLFATKPIIELYTRFNQKTCKGVVRPIPAIFVHIPPFDFIPLDRQLEILLELSARISQKPVVQVVGGVLVNDRDEILACKRVLIR